MSAETGHDIDVTTNFKAYLNDIAQSYIEYFESETELGGKWSIDTIYSPKEYNFETDTIILSWEKENLDETKMEKLFNEFLENTGDDFENFEMYDGMRGYELLENNTEYTVMIDGEKYIPINNDALGGYVLVEID